MQNQIIVNNNLISYTQFGTGEKVVLFLHGWRSNKEVWTQVASSMYQVASVYALDFPGFGQSPAPSKIFSVLDYAEVVKGFIEKLVRQPADKNVILVGHSFGGRVGIKLASQYPSILYKLVLVDSAGFAMDSSKKNVLNFMAKLVRPAFKPKSMQNIRKKIYKILGAEDYVATPEMQQIFLNVVNEDLTEDMKRVSVPTLIIWGENDKETPVEFGKRMELKIKNSKLKILPNAGHFSFLDKPEEFVSIISQFVK